MDDTVWPGALLVGGEIIGVWRRSAADISLKRGAVSPRPSVRPLRLRLAHYRCPASKLRSPSAGARPRVARLRTVLSPTPTEIFATSHNSCVDHPYVEGGSKIPAIHSASWHKRPGLAITSIISLTLGIGATTAVFSVIYGLLAHPYPYQGADRMIHLVVKNESGDDRWIGVTGSQLILLRQVKSLESVAAAWGTWNLTTTDEDLPQDVPSTQLTANAGIHFGVPALYGRTLIPSDAPEGQDPQPVVVLSYRFWERHFNSDPTVVGRTLQLVHKNYTIVGVLPPRFTWADADVYLPLKVTNDANIQFDPTRQAAARGDACSRERGTASLVEAVRERDTHPFSEEVPCPGEGTQRSVRGAAGPVALPAVRSGRCCSRGVRERLHPASGARHGAAA